MRPAADADCSERSLDGPVQGFRLARHAVAWRPLTARQHLHIPAYGLDFHEYAARLVSGAHAIALQGLLGSDESQLSCRLAATAQLAIS